MNRIKKSSWIFIFILFTFSTNLLAYEIRLYPPHQIYISKEKLVVNLKTSEGVLNDEFKNYLKFGITIHFTYFINLYEKKFLFDTLLSSKTIQKTIYYDLWNKKYRLTQYTPQKSELTFKKLIELHPYLNDLEYVNIINANKIKPKKEYYFKTRVTTKISQFKSYFHIIFSLLSIYKYKTTWVESADYLGDALLKPEVKSKKKIEKK